MERKEEGWLYGISRLTPHIHTHTLRDPTSIDPNATRFRRAHVPHFNIPLSATAMRTRQTFKIAFFFTYHVFRDPSPFRPHRVLCFAPHCTAHSTFRIRALSRPVSREEVFASEESVIERFEGRYRSSDDGDEEFRLRPVQDIVSGPGDVALVGESGEESGFYYSTDSGAEG